MPTLVNVENVSKKFFIGINRPASLAEFLLSRLTRRHSNGREFWALRDVSFSLGKGCVLGVIGHNGAGKSTLLRLISGLGRPTSGRIYCTGRIGSILELGSGFQGDLTGRQNLMTGGILAGLRRKQVLEREEEIIAFAELEDFIDQPMRTYSNGMFLRLAFTTAILFNPDFLVIDEVLAVGDHRFQKKCLDLLHEFRLSGKSIILVSHSMEEVKALCDEVLVLEEGQVAIHADPETAINHYHDLMRLRTEKKRKDLEVNKKISPRKSATRNRTGTGEVTIDEVNLYTLEGKPLEIAANNQGIIIELSYSSQEIVPDMALTLGLYSQSNVQCFETSISSVKSKLGYFPCQGAFRCQMHALPLFPGRYYINVGLFAPNWDYMYDYHWQMHTIDIKSASNLSLETCGIISIDFSWSQVEDGNLKFHHGNLS
jgi:lipopolysaccharide transport system ATP-binding protein